MNILYITHAGFDTPGPNNQMAEAKEELGWEAQFGIEEMCRDSWNWQKNNPNGYR